MFLISTKSEILLLNYAQVTLFGTWNFAFSKNGSLIMLYSSTS